MKQPLSMHPLRNSLRLQLTRHPLLAELDEAAFAELAELLVIQDAHRGECLLEQGSRELRQFFVLEGLIKRTVSSLQGREMTLRFAGGASATLDSGPDGRWTGQLTEAGQTSAVTLRKTSP